jgi:NADPH-dependent curcumin reductase CurA
MRGMIVSGSLGRRGEFEKEVRGYLQSGKPKNKETVAEGLNQAEGSFIGLFAATNIGRMVMKPDFAAVSKMCLFLSSSFVDPATDR